MKKAGEFDDSLTYRIPDEDSSKYKVGKGVIVELRKTKVNGIIVKIQEELQGGIKKELIKPIVGLIDIELCKRQIDLAMKISKYYHSSLTRVLRLMIPGPIWKGKNSIPTLNYYSLKKDAPEVKGGKQKLAVDQLLHLGQMSESDLRTKGNISLATLRSLVEKGVINKVAKPKYSKVKSDIFPFTKSEHKLTTEQKFIVNEISNADKPILIHGVTGSGKTEIYLRTILEAVKKGSQAILLVPEIALTPQMVDYFRDYFGKHIAVFNSKLSEGERLNEWWKVKSGYAPVVIGSRSAIFAPIRNLGVVIMDEEHEWTYKQESSPYYETHQIANWLHELHASKVIFGSATPRLETLHHAKSKTYNYCHLPSRINKKEMPNIEVVSLSDEFKAKNFSIFSGKLQKHITDRLNKKEQIILFVNRRGAARAVVCRDCGYTEKCPHCEVSLKYHKNYSTNQDFLLCHYCNHKKNPPLNCPECKSPHIRYIGVGTQKVEEECKRHFPNCRVIRADMDTTRKKDGFKPIYEAFKNKEYDILVGTQMIAKGLDFENVTLIGLILADIGLHSPDFRSHERLFQLITQVSGRCGRGKVKGEVILQTYNPDHFAILKAANYQYEEFAEKELTFRKKLGYPPFSKFIKFVIVGKDDRKLNEQINKEIEILENICETNHISCKIRSAPALIPKMADRYYYHVLLRSESPEEIFNYWEVPKYWRIDVDPINTI